MSSLQVFGISEQASLWGLNIVIQATVLAAVLLFISLFLRKQAALRYWVLCIGLVLIACSPASSAVMQASGISWLRIAAVQDSKFQAERFNEGAKSLAVSAEPSDTMERSAAVATNVKEFPDRSTNGTLSPLTVTEAAARDVLLRKPTTPASSFNLFQYSVQVLIEMIVLIWILGSIFLLTRMFMAWIRLSRILRAAKPIEDEQLKGVFDRACVKVGCRVDQRPRFVTSNEVSGPIAAGLLFGKVVIPESLLDHVDSESLFDILVHEIAHVVRKDHIVVLLQNMVSAIYWPHPLVRRLNCELAKAREEVCDNFVLAATGAPTYSRTLLSLAQVLKHSVATPGSVGFFTSHWKLEHRISGLLDKQRDRTTSLGGRGWFFVAAISGVLAALTSIGTISVATAQVGVVSSTDSQTVSKVILVSGVVLKPDGSPAEGAVIRAAAPVYADMRRILGEGFEPTVKEAIADKQGRFKIAIDAEPYGSLPIKGTVWKDLWKRTVISAAKPGFGGQFTKYEEVEGGDSITLQLVEDAPIRGRVIDPEGKPVSDVAIELKDINVAPSENLDAWLNAVRNSESPWTAASHVSRKVEPRMLGIPKVISTDSEGAFSIKGLGRERCIQLRVHGNGVAFDEFQCVSRLMNPTAWNDAGPNDSIFGAEFTYTGHPSRPVIGKVTDAKTGEPLVGVEVGAETLSGTKTGGRWLLTTKSDSHGNFQIDGMPKGKGNRLMFRPSDDQPFLMREFDVPDPDGMEPVSIEVGLHRGIWIEGKVVDKQTREPVACARVHYLPFQTNPFAKELPEFDRWIVHGQQDRYQTDTSGRYRLVGLPGPAVVGVESLNKPYRYGVGYDELTVPKDMNGAQTYPNPLFPRPRWPDVMTQIELNAESERVQLDFELDPGQTIRVSVFDESNEWLTGGILVNGMARRAQRIKIDRTPIEVTNIAPSGTRELVVYHESRGLGIVHQLTEKEIADGNLSLKALPCAKVTGRLVSNGEPLSGVEVTPSIAAVGDWVQSLPAVTTDEKGYFSADLIPGCKYKLDFRGKALPFAQFDGPIEITPGENLELGTLVFFSEDRSFKRTKDLQ